VLQAESDAFGESVGTEVISQFLNTVYRKFKGNIYWVNYRMSSDKKTKEDRRLDRLEFGKPLGQNLEKAKDYYVKYVDSTKSDVQIRINRIKKVLEKEGLPVPEAHTEVASMSAPVSSISPPTVAAIAEPAPQLTVGSTPSVLSSQSAVFANESEVASAAVGSSASSSGAGPFHIPDFGNAGASSMSSSSSASHYYGDVSESKGEEEATVVSSHTKEVLGEGKESLSMECRQLYDPCTREPIATIKLLEQRIREIKKLADVIPVGLYGLTNKTSNYDFITNVFTNPNISLDDMVSFRLSKDRTPGSDVYEVLSRVFVFLGGIADVNPRDDGNYKFMKKIEGTAPHVYSSSVDALKSMECLASRKMGISDITLTRTGGGRVVKQTDAYCEVDCDVSDSKVVKTYLMSVKWYSDEKNAEHYDLEKLYTASQKITSKEQQPLSIIVFLKSKTDFQIAHNRSYRQYVREIGDTFFGWHEDVKPFLEDKRRSLFETAQLLGITPKEAFERQYFTEGSKPVLSLQLHQDIIVKGMCDSLDKSTDNLYLVGVVPRGGKTYIAGGIIREFLRRHSNTNLNVLWLTAAPNETRSQVKDDLIDKFQDFNTFDFIDAKTETTSLGKSKPNKVVFCSSQLLVQTKKEGAKVRAFLQNLLTAKDQLGMVFFDEAHKTGTGSQTKGEISSIIETYAVYNLPFIFLTATYYNIKLDYQVSKENTFIWDYTDVLATRALATESEQEKATMNLQARFGETLVKDILSRRLTNGDTLETMAKAYIGFPDLYFISTDFNPEAIARFEEQNVYRPDSGFSLSSIFAIKANSTIRDIKTADNVIRKDAHLIFENQDNPKNMIAVITPSGKFDEEGTSGKLLTKEEGSYIEPSILGRINKYSRESQSRFRLDEKPTMLMFMPVGGTGSNIYYLLCAWATLLMTHSFWKDNYEVACVVEEESLTSEDMAALINKSNESSSSIRIINKDSKASIMKYERELHCRERPKGLVILAGEKLSMGISLPCTDVVFLFNEKKSPDDIIQKMYRALTPSKDKKSAYVVDLNPVRTLAAIYGYTRASHEGSNTKSEILDIIYDTYTWDGDVFEHSLSKGSETKPLSFQERLGQLFEQAEKDSEYKVNEDMGGYEKKLANNVRRGMDPVFVSTLRGKFSSEKLAGIAGRIGLSEETTIQIDKSGKLVMRKKVPKPTAEGENPTIEEVEYVIENFVETLSDFVKYLAITSSKPTLEQALAEYESSAIDGEGTSLESNVLKLVRARTPIKGLEDGLLSKLLVTAIKDFASQSSSMVYRQMKGKVDEKSVRKNAILQIIHKRLTPRNKQKQEFGEVFTPVELVERMLDHLPKLVWANPNLTWLDPANGIGNFPIVVFYRLDEGLKVWEKNDDKRRKHIIEKMLYMIEIQSNNSRIARNLFEKLCDGCKPNILTMDSLAVTSTKLMAKGFPESFDIIMGNPPFNPGILWAKFIDKYTPLAKYTLMFIVPSTFTSNVTGEPIVVKMKENGLKIVQFLELADFNNKIDLDTLYFVLEKGYKGDIKINNIVDIERSKPLINFKHEADKQIFDKLLQSVKDHGSVPLYKGKNDTLTHKKPIETSNIKFKQSSDFPNRMLSRLGGGTHEYYWLKTYIKEEVDGSKIVFPRGTASYNSVNKLMKLNEDIVYNTCVKNNEILSNSIMYAPLKNVDDCDKMRWYLMRSKIVRYIFLKVNHLAELTKTIFNYIPNLDVSKLTTDEDVYRELKLGVSEVKYLEAMFTSYVQKKEVSEDDLEGGMASSSSSSSSSSSGSPRKSRYPNRTRKHRR